MNEGTLYLIGYGNRPPEEFFACLAPLAIDVALDARLIPWGWHVRYRGEAFLRSLERDGRVGRARHAGRLGNLAKREGGPMRLADPEAIADLVRVLRGGRSVVVICGCGNGTTCHRALIGRLVTAAAPEIPVIELAVAKSTDEVEPSDPVQSAGTPELALPVEPDIPTSPAESPDPA
jgi:hypothetical protein